MGVRYPFDSPCTFVMGGVRLPVLDSVINISRDMLAVSDFNVFYVHFYLVKLFVIKCTRIADAWLYSSDEYSRSWIQNQVIAWSGSR